MPEPINVDDLVAVVEAARTGDEPFLRNFLRVYTNIEHVCFEYGVDCTIHFKGDRHPFSVRACLEEWVAWDAWENLFSWPPLFIEWHILNGIPLPEIIKEAMELGI